jgi:selenium-binding protein 1
MKRSLSIIAIVLCVAMVLVSCKKQMAEQDKAKPAAMQREKLLYAACVNVGKEDPDFVAVVGVDPADPSTYGKIIHRVDMLKAGDELHHFGYNHDRTYLMVPGLFSGRIYIVDVSDPKKPFVKSVNEDLTKKSGYTTPHTVIGLENGNNLVTMIGANSASTAPGGVVEVNGDTGEFVRAFGPAAERDFERIPPQYMYDAGIKPELNRMVTTSFGLPKDVAPGITVDRLGTDVYIWDWKKQEVIQTANIGAGTGALEVRWRAEKGSTVGYTNAPGSDEIWAWDDLDGDGKYTFRPVVKLPKGSVPTDMLLTDDDKYMYVSNWMGNNVQQYNVEDPLHPVLVSQVEIPYAQMLRISPDKKRLYVTNSLLSSWDDTELPKGVTRNSRYGIFLVDVDHENGGMTLNKDFHVDMMHVQKKNTKGPARPHMMLFGPSIKSPFGHH